ncbi:MAG: N-acetyltransferase [Bacteroidales bacterium]|nr:N-acetyltransferase [Bacteroidales bacterium]
MLNIRPASPSDLPALREVFDAAKAIMRADGNASQWAGAYPDEGVLLRDIAGGRGHVLLAEDGSVAGYFAMIPSPEPTYSYIEDGAWLDDTLPYLVIHRIASRPEVHGVFASVIACAAARCPNLRIDTHRDNRIMQHNLLKHGFSYCGIIYLADGAQRLAYQRLTRPDQNNNQ